MAKLATTDSTIQTEPTLLQSPKKLGILLVLSMALLIIILDTRC